MNDVFTSELQKTVQDEIDNKLVHQLFTFEEPTNLTTLALLTEPTECLNTLHIDEKFKIWIIGWKLDKDAFIKFLSYYI